MGAFRQSNRQSLLVGALPSQNATRLPPPSAVTVVAGRFSARTEAGSTLRAWRTLAPACPQTRSRTACGQAPSPGCSSYQTHRARFRVQTIGGVIYA
jgi:hypothetical protein